MTAGQIASNIAHGLFGILQFRGRDTGVQFWHYVAFLFAIMFFIPAAPALDLYRELGSADRAAFLARVAPTDEEHMYLNMYEMQGMFGMIRQIFLLLLTAAMVRRLHDVGRSGGHALINVLISLWSLGGALVASWDFGQSVATMLTARQVMFWTGLLWLAHFTYLVVQLMRQTDPGFNRAGEPAVTGRQVQIENLRRRSFAKRAVDDPPR